MVYWKYFSHSASRRSSENLRIHIVSQDYDIGVSPPGTLVSGRRLRRSRGKSLKDLSDADSPTYINLILTYMLTASGRRPMQWGVMSYRGHP